MVDTLSGVNVKLACGELNISKVFIKESLHPLLEVTINSTS